MTMPIVLSWSVIAVITIACFCRGQKYRRCLGDRERGLARDIALARGKARDIALARGIFDARCSVIGKGRDA
jgi:hypothetical protein